MHVVFSGKAWHHIVLVFPYALYEIGCDTLIQGSVSATGQWSWPHGIANDLLIDYRRW